MSASEYREVFEHYPDGVLVATLEGQVLAANGVALESLGHPPSLLHASNIVDLLVDSSGTSVGTRPFQIRSFRGELGLIRSDGSRFPAEVVSREVAGEGGASLVMFFFRDLSAQRSRDRRYSEYLRLEQKARLDAELAQRRAGYLAQVTGKLAASLDGEESIRNIVELSVHGFATFCIVYLLPEPDRFAAVALSHEDPALWSTLDRLRDHRVARTEETVLSAIVESSESLLLTGSELRIDEVLAIDERHREVLRALQPSSAMLVPVRARGQVLGILAFFKGDRDPIPYAEEDVRVAETLAQTAAFSLDNARLYRDAKQADQARQEFLSAVAHDLRSPLAAISVSAEMLLEFELSEQARRQHLEIVRRASSRMSRLIQDLTDAAKIESGHLALALAEEDVAVLLDEALEPFLIRAAQQKILLQRTTEPDVPRVLVDRSRVLQVLSNLLENALRFVPASGEIRVEAESAGGLVWIAVHDSGSGIQAEDLPHVFHRFWQGHGGRAGGAGLGLAISRGIVEAHGGSISVQSVRQQGTTFRFSLPPGPTR